MVVSKQVVDEINGVLVKMCGICFEFKPMTDFYQNINSRYGSLPNCKTCTTKRNYSRQTAETKFKRSRSRILQKMKISYEDYQKMLENQSGVCAICKGKDEDMMLHIDHDHDTNKIRGLLCKRCNSGIGMFKENVEFLREAVKYLDNHLAKK